MNYFLLPLCLILQEGATGQEPLPVGPDEADARITARDGSPAPSTHSSGSLTLSARKSVYGKHSKSVEWEIEPKGLDSRAERGVFLETDNSLNPIIIIGYADYPVTSLIREGDTYGIVIRLYTALNDTQDRERIFIAIKSDIPPPVPPGPGPQPTPPDPKPPVPPTPITAKHLIVAAIHQPNVTPDQAIVLHNFWTTYIPELKRRGHQGYRLGAADATPLGTKLKSEGITNYPSVTIWESSDAGQPLRRMHSFELPSSIEEIDAWVKRYESR